MTIFAQINPENYSWPLYGYNGWRTADPFRFHTWDDTCWENYGGFHLRGNVTSIPVQIGHSQRNSAFPYYFELTDSDSDSESDNDDVNQNSLPMRRKRRYEGTLRSSAGYLDTKSAAHGPLVSPTKQEFTGSGAHCSTLQQHLGTRSDCESTDKRKYKTRSCTENDVVLVDDIEEPECEINELTNYDVYKHLKVLLKKHGRCIDEMRGDGNCFFRALSKVVYGNQKFYNDIRQTVVDLIAQYPRKFEAVTDGPVSSHIRLMRQDKTWATQTEIYAAATLLGRPIYILSPDQGGDNYKWLLFSPLFQYNTAKLDDPCYVTICHTHGNHYDRIAPLVGKCNCELEPPELSGIQDSVDLTIDENEIV